MDNLNFLQQEMSNVSIDISQYSSFFNTNALCLPKFGHLVPVRAREKNFVVKGTKLNMLLAAIVGLNLVTTLCAVSK